MISFCFGTSVWIVEVLKELKVSHDGDQIINPIPACQQLSIDAAAAMAWLNLCKDFGIILI